VESSLEWTWMRRLKLRALWDHVSKFSIYTNSPSYVLFLQSTGTGEGAKFDGRNQAMKRQHPTAENFIKIRQVIFSLYGNAFYT
jgi:hypothetical protein